MIAARLLFVPKSPAVRNTANVGNVKGTAEGIEIQEHMVISATNNAHKIVDFVLCEDIV